MDMVGEITGEIFIETEHPEVFKEALSLDDLECMNGEAVEGGYQVKFRFESMGTALSALDDLVMNASITESIIKGEM